MYRLLPTLSLAAGLAIAPGAYAVLVNPGFSPEAVFTEASPPTAWDLRDQESRALISQVGFAHTGSNVFRFEVLERGFGPNKLEQCVFRPSGTDFDFGVMLRSPMPDEGLALRLNIEFYGNRDNCQEREDRFSIGNDDFDFDLDIAANVWTEFRSGSYDSSDLASAGNPQWARISIRVRDRSDDGNPGDPPRIVYLDHVTGPNGELVENGDFSVVEFPGLVEFDEDSGPIGYTMRDLEDGAVVETRDFARSNGRVFRFNQLTDAFGDNKLEQCVALPSGTNSVQFGTWVRTPQPSEELGVRLNMDFYPGLEDCLFRNNRIQRTDSDVFLVPEQYQANTWERIQTTSVPVSELPTTAGYVRIRVSARDTSGANTPLFFDDIGTNLVNPQLTGAWFDPATAGQGFNLQSTTVGLFGYYYGYDNGDQLWLQLGIHDGPIVFGQPIDVPVFGPSGGTFGQPDDPTAPPVWGRMVTTFESCTSATATLTGPGISQSFDLGLLATIDGLQIPDCTDFAGSDQPVQLTAAWFDPATSGQGWNFLYAPNGLFGYFYGYTATGEPLWLATGNVPVTLGEPVTLDLFYGQGGTFTAPVAPEALETWGTAEVTFSDCRNAELTISGVDGVQDQSITVLVLTEGLTDC
ncbi:MAG: hypothetical protein EA418_12755 [Wenzhouxiangellaceae bacterium]|nr:MAG: hypothetical protein EA418_12755 [Wenzhouxiangellaceae bacterium]